MNVEKVMDRQKIANCVHTILDEGVKLLGKDEMDRGDFAKIKLMRGMGTHVNAAVTMVQQETSQQRIQVIRERMTQLGFDKPKELTT